MTLGRSHKTRGLKDEFWQKKVVLVWMGSFRSDEHFFFWQVSILEREKKRTLDWNLELSFLYYWRFKRTGLKSTFSYVGLLRFLRIIGIDKRWVMEKSWQIYKIWALLNWSFHEVCETCNWVVIELLEKVNS